MSILKEPYDPGYLYQWKNSNLFPKHFVQIQLKETEPNWVSIGSSAIMLATFTGLSFLWWPALLFNILILIAWVAFPSSRVIHHQRANYLVRDEIRYAAQWKMPAIDYNACEHPIYDDAVNDWIEAVRQSGDVSIHRDSWQKYLNQAKSLAGQQLDLKPDFEKLKIIKELMQ